MTDTWLDLATHLQPGASVIFNRPMPYGAHGEIPAGTIMRVKENSLNEMQAALVLQGAGEEDEVVVPGPGRPDSPEWQEPAIVSEVM